MANQNIVVDPSTGAVTGIAPGSAGNVLTSDGTAWASSPASGGSSATGMLAPVRVATRGDETYTISGGNVTQIAGTVVDDISPAVGDRILVFSAPASTGVGSYGSTTPGNGVYVVTSNTTNLSVARAADMSGTVKPAGLAVEAAAGTWFHTNLFLVEVPENPAVAHTYGTDSLRWIINVVPGPATTGTSQTLTSKTIDGASNTLIVRNADIPNGLNNNNSARQSQVTVANTAYYITGSRLALPATLKVGMVVGTKFVWRVAMDKTAAGTVSFEILIYRGVNGTTADTLDVPQTIGVQTAAVDNMIVDVEVVVTATGATGSYYWTIIPVNRASTAAAAAGFGVPFGTTGYRSGTVSSVALNTASTGFGLGFRSTTGTPTITVPMVQAQAFNLS